MALKWYQDPEWSNLILEQAAEDTLAKTRMYNADADVWRLLKPFDLGMATIPVGGAVNYQYWNVVAIPAATPTVVIAYRMPAGIGITLMGLWCTGVGDLGQGAVYIVRVNNVDRCEIPLRHHIPGKGGAFGFDTNGLYGDWAVRIIALEQFVFLRQNDQVQHIFFTKHGFSGQLEWFPIAVVAGNRKQLLVAE